MCISQTPIKVTGMPNPNLLLKGQVHCNKHFSLLGTPVIQPLISYLSSLYTAITGYTCLKTRIVMKWSSEIWIYYQLPGFSTLRDCLVQTTFDLPPLLITIICGDSANTLLQGIIATQTLLKLTQDVQDYKPSRHGVFFCLSNLTFPNITKARQVPNREIPACLFLKVTSYRANRCKEKKKRQKTQCLHIPTEINVLGKAHLEQFSFCSVFFIETSTQAWSLSQNSISESSDWKCH